jgi:hypothetical protein
MIIVQRALRTLYHVKFVHTQGPPAGLDPQFVISCFLWPWLCAHPAPIHSYPCALSPSIDHRPVSPERYSASRPEMQTDNQAMAGIMKEQDVEDEQVHKDQLLITGSPTSTACQMPAVILRPNVTAVPAG